MPDGVTAPTLSPAPIIDCIDRYRGTITDIDAGIVWTGDKFAAAREALTKALSRAGLAAGDRVAIAVSNGPLFIAALGGILACGASPLLLHCKTPAAELLRYAKRFGLKFLASEPEENVALAARTEATIAFGPQALILSRFALDERELAAPTLRGVPLHPSSGSTGLPKVALRPGFAAIEEARHYADTMGIGADDCIFAIPPMSHAYGYGVSAMMPMLTGANLVTTRNFSVQTFWRAVAECGPTVLPLTPAMIDALSMTRADSLARTRWTLCAGSVLTQKTMERFRQHTGVVVRPLYGTTETGGITVGVTPGEVFVDGRVGQAMEGVEVEARAGEGDLGKLFVRSSSMMAGYLDDGDRLIDATDNGWFETGDLARIEPGGVIHLRGRDSEVINLSGLKVVPIEVEEAIAQLPGVVEVKVYKGEHAFGLPIVKAAVAVKDGVTEADVRAHCKQHLVYYKRPHTVRLVDRLPRTPAGKIDVPRLP